MGFWCGLMGHRWNACRCKRCGKQRDQKHDFVLVEGKCLQRCAICGNEEETHHAWRYCACSRCGETREGIEEDAHDWMDTAVCEQICRICGKERARHSWQPVDRGLDRCRNCDKLHRLTADEVLQRDEVWADEYD